MVTGVILTHNEEPNVVGCVQNLRPHVQEMILIDTGSTDRTVELARPLVDRILTHPHVPNFDAARNIAIPAAHHEWLWFLDADERVPARTGALVKRLIEERGRQLVAITIPFKSYFSGRWMQHCGWWPGYTMPRVLKRGHFRFADQLHGGVEFHGPELRLPPDPELAIEHFSYLSIEHYLEKFNRYTSIEAQSLAARNAPLDWQHGIRHMTHDLWQYYEQNAGEQDGLHGWILSWLAGQYRWFSQAKLIDNENYRDKIDQASIPRSLDDVVQEMSDELTRLRRRTPRLPLGIVWRSPLWDPSGYADDGRAVLNIRRQFSLEHATEAIEGLVAAAEERFQPKTVAPPAPAAIRVELEGEFFAGHSFSNINEQLAGEWLQNDELAVALRRVVLNPTQDDRVPGAHELRPYFGRTFGDGPQVTIRHAFPPNWRPPATGKWVHIQPWEYGALPIDWVAPLRDEVDEIWAPSEYVKRVYVASGVPAEKIVVIPWGINPNVYRPDVPALHLATEKSFKFLFVGGTIPRKGFDLLLEAYRQEFQPSHDVCLVVKDQGTASFYRYGNYRDQVRKIIEQGGTADIVYLDHEMTDGGRASLYAACDCLVAPYRGEGFGLPVLEGMACGLAPIVPRGGATDDFVDDGTAWMLPAKVVECDHQWRLCGVATELSIEVADLRQLLRNAFENREETRAKGMLASERVREQFTWQRSAERMVERIKALVRGDRATPARPEATPVRSSFPSLTACVLTRDDERSLADCLGRVRPFMRFAHKCPRDHRVGPWLDRPHDSRGN